MIPEVSLVWDWFNEQGIWYLQVRFLTRPARWHSGKRYLPLTKHDDLNLLRIHKAEGENPLFKVVLWPQHVSFYACTLLPPRIHSK